MIQINANTCPYHYFLCSAMLSLTLTSKVVMPSTILWYLLMTQCQTTRPRTSFEPNCKDTPGESDVEPKCAPQKSTISRHEGVNIDNRLALAEGCGGRFCPQVLFCDVSPRFQGTLAIRYVHESRISQCGLRHREDFGNRCFQHHRTQKQGCCMRECDGNLLGEDTPAVCFFAIEPRL